MARGGLEATERAIPVLRNVKGAQVEAVIEEESADGASAAAEAARTTAIALQTAGGACPVMKAVVAARPAETGAVAALGRTAGIAAGVMSAPRRDERITGGLRRRLQAAGCHHSEALADLQ